MDNLVKNKFVVGWTLTDGCNLRCKHCYNASGKPKPDELSREQASHVAEKLIADGRVEAVNFGGGECATRPDFLSIVERLCAGGIKVSYTTNGTTHKRLKHKLQLFNDIGVSMEFIDEKKQNDFRGSKKIYKTIRESIDFYVENGANTEIVTCLTAQNCDITNLEGIFNFAKDRNVNYWRLNRYRSAGRIESRRELELTPDMLKESYSFLAGLIKGDTSTPDPLFALLGGNFINAGCSCGTSSMRILANGNVSPCTYLQVSGGNILNDTLDDILNSDIFQQLRERTMVGKCKTCQVSSVCKGGCAGSTYTLYGSFDKPDPLCWHNVGDDIKRVPAIKQGRWKNVHEGYLCTLYVKVK